MTKISSFVNNDGVMVHAAFVTTELTSQYGDKYTIQQHQGTFATRGEAEKCVEAVLNGTYHDDDMVD